MNVVWAPPKSSGGGSAIMLGAGQKLMWTPCLFMVAVTIQFLTQPAAAAPILASSLGYCQDVPIKADPNNPLDCCLPKPTNTPRYFKLPVNPILRERKPAHVLSRDPEYVKKYNEAYKLMRALKKGDPLSWDTQWKTHCSFCNEAFLQRYLPAPEGPDSGIPLQVHYSWLFLPWHRMLIYFHEKTLGKLIGDPNFALPFWNWDNQKDVGANQIPAMFLPGFSLENNTALISPNRNIKHFPPQMLPLDYNSAAELNASIPEKTPQQIIDDNLCIVYNQVVTKVSAREFMGGPYVIGTDNSAASVPEGVTPGESGGCENLHNTAHEWVGFINDPSHPDNEDMGNFIYAGKDPVFYSHHSNVDRLWDVWKTLPDNTTKSGMRKRQDYMDRDFLDTEFTFYDENREMVIVKVRDTLSSAKLGYKYTDMSETDRLWIEHKPKNATTTQSKMTTSAWKQDYPEVNPTANNTISDTPVCFKVSRRAPTKEDLIGKQVKHKMQLTEGVVMEGLRVPHTCYIRFDAYVDNPSATEMTDVDQAGFVGSFTHLPSAVVNASSPIVREDVKEEALYRTINVRFSISNALSRLGINDYDTDITITIVPMMRVNAETTLTFKTLRQEFL